MIETPRRLFLVGKRDRVSQHFLQKLALLLCLAAATSTTGLHAQSLLTANGETAAYTRIQDILFAAPETPDCSHPGFGPHITQAIDDDANFNKYVFVFNIHVTPDNDRCVAFDRQRLEIKTEGTSKTPDALLGFLGDSVTFRWQFKLPVGFQPSTAFTHIHQIKAFNGDDSAPLMTLTPRKANPNRVELIHIDSKGVTTKLATTQLAPFLGQWVEAYEKITYSHNGQYSIVLTSVDSGTVLFSYSNNNLDLWRTGTTIVRPKWGIYRSLDDSADLRDEQVRYDRFCLAKGTTDCISDSQSPEFSMTAVPPSSPLGNGGSTSIEVSAAALRDFTGDIALSVTGLPPGVTAQFSPDTISGGTGSATLTVATSPTTPPGDYSLVIEGIHDPLSHVASVPLTIATDTTPPVTTAFVTPAPNGNGWNNSNAIVTLQSSDNVPPISGVKQITYSESGSQNVGNTVVPGASASVVVNTEGVATITFFGTDSAGNIEAPQGMIVRLDRTPPIMTGSALPAANTNGWNNAPVTVSFACTDALSGLALGFPPPPVFLSSEGINEQVAGSCQDLAGNVASVVVAGINIDKTPPSIVATLAPLPNANVWNNSDVTISFAAVDALSGVSSVTSPVLVQTEGRNQLFTGVATDRAGNPNSITVSVNLDKTPPEAFQEFDPASHDVVLFGRDALSGVAPAPIAPTSVRNLFEDKDERERNWGRAVRDHDGDDPIVELRTYTILDLAGNPLVLTERVRKTEHSIRVRIQSLQYGGQPVIPVERNLESFEWESGRDGNLRALEQQMEAGEGRQAQEVSAHFEIEDNRTVIRQQSRPRRRSVPGLALLQMTTQSGKLVIQF
jgi:hypothetical protein